MPAPRLEVSEAKKRLIVEGYSCGDSLEELRLRAGVSVTVVRRILLERDQKLFAQELFLH